MVGSPCAQDVADALALTFERQDDSGAPWCPPRDASAVRQWVVDRSASLGGGIRRVVRLARLLSVADGRDYVTFLYLRLPLLRPRQFEHALRAAAAEGRLPPSIATLSTTSVRMSEPQVVTEGGAHSGFEIDFAQMPRLAALLDFLHNALGFTVVADLLAPVLARGTPTKSANDVARALHAAINAWLSERLESTNHIRQAQRIRAFLATRGRVAPEAVDDEAILLFWMTVGAIADEEAIDGFRLYRSAACALFRYSHALRDATVARQLEKSLGLRQETRNGEPAIDRIVAFEPSIEPWRSPLRALVARPASRIKWLTRKEQYRLLNFLGGPADPQQPDEPGAEDEAEIWEGGLAGDERFDLNYWLTLLRADVFGSVQASIVARLRKRVPPAEAVAAAIAAVDSEAYRTCASAYSDLHDQLRLECLAALAALMEVGAAEAIILINHLGGQQAVTDLVGSAVPLVVEAADQEEVADVVREEIAGILKAALADPGKVSKGRELLLEARAATRKVNRMGFRREISATPKCWQRYNPAPRS